MAMVKCEYCASYISDTEEKCSSCGATNKNFKRAVDGTPKTIDELKNWYIARKLPPEEVTRFFIGKDVKEPRAFGIYEEDGRFIVYKNKSNGSRAIRYEGRDEAYAVKELYLRLKHEILNQKNVNANRRNKSSKNHSTYKMRKKTCLLAFLPLIVIIILQIIVVMGLLDIFESSDRYYMSDTGEIYYFDQYESEYNGYIWWKYDKATKEWNIYESYKTKDKKPSGVTEENGFTSVYKLTDKYGGNPDELDIYKSKTYIDAGNHMTPRTSYYAYNNKLYYFLDDTHSSYGTSDNTGWYVFDKNKWNYYCAEDDKEKLGEDLWYSDSDYRISNRYSDIYDYQDEFSTKWNPTNFEDTIWYKSYEKNEAAYDRHIEERENRNDDWSSDSDWDWDSSDSWDSGSTDWDSDW